MRKYIHTHIPMYELQEQIRAGITLQGFAIRHVLASEHEPAFSYTVGLHTPGSQKPEIVISGLQTETRVAWLLDIGFRIQGPPPLETRRQMAQAQGVPLEALKFPPGGAIFQPGKRYRDLAGHGLPAMFAEVSPAYIESHLGQAVVFHQTQTFPAIQLIWCDPLGFFPWEAAFDPHFRSKQRLLFDQRRLLRAKQ